MVKMIFKQKLKHIVFLRNPEEPPVWGGLEKLMLDWFKRIDYDQHKVTLAISRKWVEIFEKKIQNENVPIKVVALPYGHKQGSVLKRFFKLFPFFKKFKTFFGGIYSKAGFFLLILLMFWRDSSRPLEGSICMKIWRLPYPCPSQAKGILGLFQGVGHMVVYSNSNLARSRAVISKKTLVVSRGIKENLISLWHYPANKILVQYHGSI